METSRFPLPRHALPVRPAVSPFLFSLLFVCLLALILSGCGSPVGLAAPDEASPAPAVTAEALAAPVLEQAPAPAIAEPEYPALLEAQTAVESLSSQEEPLRFVFPDPKPAPISAWRPPLYQTPWAPTPYDHFFFTRPIAADQVNWPLADYRYGGSFMEGVVHTGVDIPSPLDTPVLAAGPGKVTWAGYGLYYQNEDRTDDPYGLAVAIKHDFGYEGVQLYTIYGHMDTVLVISGQHVEGGEVLGKVGTTGLTTGPHLHFEVRLKKNNFFGSRNPELWMAPPQGWGLLAGRVTDSRGRLLTGQTITVHSYATAQKWEVKTYEEGSTNEDPFYRENVVMGDLPAGHYKIWINYQGVVYNQDIEIRPGLISYFTFKGGSYQLDLPSDPGEEFSLEDFIVPEAAAESGPGS